MSTNIVASNIKWVMLVSGVLTMTMIYALIAPHAALMSTFGEALPASPVTEIVVRSWGALIGLVGAMLIYGAFHPEVRTLVLTVAALSKAIFVVLLLSHGNHFLSHQAGLAVASMLYG